MSPRTMTALVCRTTYEYAHVTVTVPTDATDDRVRDALDTAMEGDHVPWSFSDGDLRVVEITDDSKDHS